MVVDMDLFDNKVTFALKKLVQKMASLRKLMVKKTINLVKIDQMKLKVQT